MQFSLLVTLLAATFAVANPVPIPDAEPADDPDHPTKRACGDGSPCLGVFLDRDSKCYDHCKAECGKRGGRCAGPGFQYCHCFET